MTEPLYIVVPNWDGPDGFQHYKDRDPIWIKNYTRLLSHDDYMSLTFTQRGLLHGIWIEYARSGRRLRSDTLTLSRRLGQKVSSRDVRKLVEHAFIELRATPEEHSTNPRGALDHASTDPQATPETHTDQPADERNHAGSNQDPASRPLADCYPSRAPARSPEPETDKEKDQNQNKRPNQEANRNGAGLDIQTELELAELLQWIGNDADSRTAAVLRHNWTHAPEAARLAVNQSRKTSRPRHRAKWLVATIKAETDRARGIAA